MVQTLIVLAILLGAVAYLGLRFYRTARSVTKKDDGCGSGCGCSPSPSGRGPG